MASKSRKNNGGNSANKTRKNQKNHMKIEHHHLLLRMETKKCPQESDKSKAKELIKRILRDIGMVLLAEPRVFYLNVPRYNAGLTALAPIQTSHIAFHFWNNPDRDILKNPESQCLLQFDLYTCGTLPLTRIQKILHHLTVYQPTHVNATVLNRNTSLSVESRSVWDGRKSSWVDWIRDVPKNLRNKNE